MLKGEVAYDNLLGRGATVLVIGQLYCLRRLFNFSYYTRYFLERIQFDMNAAVVGPGTPDVTCGGLEVPMCFALTYATWVDLAGNEIPFNRSNPSPAVTFNGPIPCPWVVPAKATTWGSIKSQYRN